MDVAYMQNCLKIKLFCAVSDMIYCCFIHILCVLYKYIYKFFCKKDQRNNP